MPWGVFEGESESHVAPCDPEGYVVGHELKSSCDCNPKQDAGADNGQVVWVHNEKV